MILKKSMTSSTLIAILISIIIIITSNYSGHTTFIDDIETNKTIIYVDDDFNETTPGWGVDHFAVIQDGVNAAVENSIVYIANGTYYENINVDKTLRLIGEDKNYTIVDGGGNGSTLKLNAEAIYISGLKLLNSELSICFDLFSSFNIIIDNIIETGMEGITVNYPSHNNTIERNIINNTYEGIVLYHSKDNIISNNSISNSIWYGIRLYHSDNNFLSHNIIKFNVMNGIHLHIANNNTINENVIIENGENGINVGMVSNNNTITRNRLEDNELFGILILQEVGPPSDGNRFYYNNFIGNKVPARDDCDNIWDNGPNDGGNYWNDYTGNDSDPIDGIGDSPYTVSGYSENQDQYPLITPFPGCPFIRGDVNCNSIPRKPETTN